MLSDIQSLIDLPFTATSLTEDTASMSLMDRFEEEDGSDSGKSRGSSGSLLTLHTSRLGDLTTEVFQNISWFTEQECCQCIMTSSTVTGGLNVHITLTLDMLSVLLLTVIIYPDRGEALQVTL